MQSLNEGLLLALKNNLNISHLQDSSGVYFDNLFNFFKEDKVLDEYYDEYYNDTFPIYPTDNYKIISSLKSFSSMKIKTVVDDNLNVLRNNLNQVVLTTKSYTDKIPENDELLRVANYLQNTIYNPNYINYEFLNFPRSTINKDQDLLGYILNISTIPNYHSSLNSFTAVDIFILYQTLLHIFNNSTNFYNVMVSNLYNLNNINKDLIKDDFYEFITYNDAHVASTSILDELLPTFILKNNFNIFSPSSNVQNMYRNFIKTEIYPDLIDTFNDFLDNDIQQDFKKEFNLNYINPVRSITFYYIFQDIINDDINSFFNSGSRDKRLDDIFSQNYINEFLNQHKTGNNLKNYLMPVYLYKNDCLKCLNTIQAFMQLYFDDKLRSKVDYIQQLRYSNETKIIINSITSNLNKSYVKSYFESLNLEQYCEDNDIPQFISFLFSNDMIQKFCNSEKFDNFIISFLDKSNEFLYGKRLINYDYNWYVNIKLIKHYFLTYFLEHINLMKDGTRQNIIFQNLEENVSSLLDDTLEFSTTENNIEDTILNLQNNKGIVDSTYNLCGNLLESMVVRQIYFQVLSYFMNE